MPPGTATQFLIQLLARHLSDGLLEDAQELSRVLRAEEEARAAAHRRLAAARDVHPSGPQRYDQRVPPLPAARTVEQPNRTDVSGSAQCPTS